MHQMKMNSILLSILSLFILPIQSEAQSLVTNTKNSQALQKSLAMTMNRTILSDDGVWLANPKFRAHFSAGSVSMSPSENKLRWEWHPSKINGLSVQPVIPKLVETDQGQYVDYTRGNIIERYQFHTGSIEQQFIVKAMPESKRIEIVGAILTEGIFSQEDHYWEWSNEVGSIRLGHLYVYDVTGAEVEANYTVASDRTTITIEEEALKDVQFPLTIDPEIGPNDFRISFMGGTGDEDFDAEEPAIAYNSANDEYLVVWRGDEIDVDLPSFDNELEIYGQRLTGDGSLIGNDFRISDMAPGLPRVQADNFRADQPEVAYNSVDKNFLVVWRGEDDTGDLVDGETEIYGKIISNIGTAMGNQFRISQVGVDGDVGRDAQRPALDYNSFDNEFLVVWEADDTTFNRLDGAPEIYGQRITAQGLEIGPDDFNISNMGPDDSRSFSANEPTIAFNPNDTNYLVCWRGRDVPLENDELENEIYGQFISAQGLEMGPDDFRISRVGPDGVLDFFVFQPDLVFNPSNNTFLVVWAGQDNTGNLVADETEVFGQFIADTGVVIGIHFRISDMGPDADTKFGAFDPKITYSSDQDQFLVVWRGDDDTGDLVVDEFEIFGQHLNAFGQEIGENDFRISDRGAVGDRFFITDHPGVVYNSQRNEYLVVFDAEDDENGLVNNEHEIFGQRIKVAEPVDGQISINNEPADSDPAVAYNATDNNYLVVWSTNDESLASEECEIFGQLFDDDGLPIAAKFRISQMGSLANDFLYDAFRPDVTYNPANNNYLVVWDADTDSLGLADNEFEIYGQLIDAGGSEFGPNDFRISDMGTDGDRFFDAGHPSVAFNAEDDEFLVVWQGRDSIQNNGVDIFGQRISSIGEEVGNNDFQVNINSNTSMSGDTLPFNARKPKIIFNANNKQYLVVWSEQVDLTNDNDEEIFGQVLNAEGEKQGDIIRISDLGPVGEQGFFAQGASVAFNGDENRYLVTWQGRDISSNPASPLEVFGQLLDAEGNELGINDFRISNTHDEIVLQSGLQTSVTYNEINKHFLVTWSGTHPDGSFVPTDLEIFGQKISSEGEEIGENDFQISFGPGLQRSFLPDLIFNSTSNQYMVVWEETSGIGAALSDFCTARLNDLSLGNPLPSANFLAGQSIVSSGVVGVGVEVSFDVSGEIILLPNFEVKANGLFEISNIGCDN